LPRLRRSPPPRSRPAQGTGADGKHIKLTRPTDIDAPLFTRWLEAAAGARAWSATSVITV